MAAQITLLNLNPGLQDQFRQDWDAAQNRYSIGIQNGMSDKEAEANYLMPVQQKWKIIESSPRLQSDPAELDKFNSDFNDATKVFATNYNQYSRDGGASAMSAPGSIAPTLQKYSVMPSRVQYNPLNSALARQDHAAALREASRIQLLMDKLDPDDPEDAKKLSVYQDQLDEVQQRLSTPMNYGQTQAPSASQAVQPQATRRPGGIQPNESGFRGDVAPVYRPGGPASELTTSGGGRIYFGPQKIDDIPPSGTISGGQDTGPGVSEAPQLPGQALNLSGGPFMAAPPMQFPIVQQGGGNPSSEVPAPIELSPNQIKKRVGVQKQLNDLPEGTPDYVKQALNAKAASLDSVTNGPSRFIIGPDAGNSEWSNDQNRLAKSGFMKGATPAGRPFKDGSGKTFYYLGDAADPKTDQDPANWQTQ